MKKPESRTGANYLEMCRENIPNRSGINTGLEKWEICDVFGKVEGGQCGWNRTKDRENNRFGDFK